VRDAVIRFIGNHHRNQQKTYRAEVMCATAWSTVAPGTADGGGTLRGGRRRTSNEKELNALLRIVVRLSVLTIQ